jgi:hypothetical protein
MRFYHAPPQPLGALQATEMMPPTIMIITLTIIITTIVIIIITIIIITTVAFIRIPHAIVVIIDHISAKPAIAAAAGRGAGGGAFPDAVDGARGIEAQRFPDATPGQIIHGPCLIFSPALIDFSLCSSLASSRAPSVHTFPSLKCLLLLKSNFGSPKRSLPSNL